MQSRGKPDNLWRLEEGLWAVANGMGSSEKVTVSQAKAELRRRGRPDLASRLGRTSKARNAQAHPDAGLVTDIKNIFDTTDVESLGCNGNSSTDSWYIGEQAASFGVQTDMGLLDMRVMAVQVAEAGVQCSRLPSSICTTCSTCSPMPFLPDRAEDDVPHDHGGECSDDCGDLASMSSSQPPTVIFNCVDQSYNDESQSFIGICDRDEVASGPLYSHLF